MLKNNKFNLLISIVCAIALWAYISTVVNPETEYTVDNIPVELTNREALNDRGFTVDEATAYSVDVTVSGPRSEVVQLDALDFRATADMTGYRRGTVSVPVNVVTPGNIELVQARPDMISVEVVDLITVYKPVRLEFEEDFANNQEPGFITITPNEMEVSGVTEAVDSIDYIRATVETGLLTEEESTFRVDVVAVDKAGNPVNNVGLSQNSVEVIGSLCTTKRVPLRMDIVGEPNETIEVTDSFVPEYITIRGSKAVIDGITEIWGRAVDLASITNTEEILLATYLELPEGVEIAEVSKDLSVRIEVQGIARKEFEYTADMIEVANLAPYLSGHVNTGSVTVTVFATQDVLDGLTQDDIRLYVDAAEHRKAESAIEIEVLAEYEADIKEIVIEPENVRVTIISAN